MGTSQAAGKTTVNDSTSSVPGALLVTGKRSGVEYLLELHGHEMG
jgi:hypothetical protein